MVNRNIDLEILVLVGTLKGASSPIDDTLMTTEERIEYIDGLSDNREYMGVLISTLLTDPSIEVRLTAATKLGEYPFNLYVASKVSQISLHIPSTNL